MRRMCSRLNRVGFDGIAIKPKERSLTSIEPSQIDRLVFDFEGMEHLPTPMTIQQLAEETEVILTAPVRHDGFDPLGDDDWFTRFEPFAKFAIVAGNRAYLDTVASKRAIAPRIGAARTRFPDAWIGTEGIERLALATGATQYELLSGGSEQVINGLRAAGFEGTIAIYAPTMITEDRTAALNQLAGYLKRRKPVARVIEAQAGNVEETGEVLDRVLDQYALVGPPATIEQRIVELKTAGADLLIAYPVGG